MTILKDYRHFAGRHWETGTVHNYYAYRGLKAPHTGRPYSEALLMGVSGGAIMGYFTFLYEGYDPQCNILTRNTFDPLETMLSRLGVVQYLERTQKAERAEGKLIDTLEEGLPAIVWADIWSLPYNALPYDKGMWGSFPILVYGFDTDADTVYVADRAGVPLTVTTEELAAARGRIKKDRFRMLTLDAPNPDKLAAAVQAGICDTIRLYTEKPPKGSKNNFGLAAYQHWAKMLTHPKQRNSWEKLFPAGLPMYAGLTSAYTLGLLFGKGLAVDGERGLYAEFLSEAAAILNKPVLEEVAGLFRVAGEAWGALGQALLPDEVAPFGEARRLLMRRHRLFLEEGGGSLEERRAISGRLEEIRERMESEFPLDEGGVVTFRERVAERVLAIHEVEKAAVEGLSAASVT